MLYLVITILALCIIAMCFTLKRLMKELKNAVEEEQTQFNRAERYFDYKVAFVDFRDILYSNLMTFDKCEKLKELVDNLEPEN